MVWRSSGVRKGAQCVRKGAVQEGGRVVWRSSGERKGAQCV